MKNDKINDIIFNEESKNNLILDITSFFEKSILKAIRLNQTNLFSDIYLELKEKIDLSKKKYIKISKLKNDLFKDVIIESKVGKNIKDMLLKKKKRILTRTISIIDNLPEVQRNTIDVRNYERLSIPKTFPDIYKLPMLPKQRMKKFYKDNKIKIKITFTKWMKYWVVFSILILSLIFSAIWYKNYIKSEITSAYTNIYSLKEIKDSNKFKDKAREIKITFKKIKILFSPINLLMNNFIYQNEDVKAAANIINWWSNTINVFYIAWAIWSDFDTEIKDFTWKKSKEDTESYNLLSNFKFTEFFKKESNNIAEINDNINDAISSYSQIKDLWNDSLNQKFSQNLESLIKLKNSISYIINNKEILLKALWDTKPVRYLILNQNKDEIRANWWFPWSAVTLELYKWSIINYDKRDIYYYDWHITPYKETPPEWLNIISPNHGLRDANYNPVFRDSVEKINFFYEKWGWWSIDTVIWINQTIIEELLRKYWPVKLDEINTQITADNFSLIMSTLVENKFMKVISPKDILFKFSENLEKKLLSKKDYFWYFDIFMNNLYAWEIVIASRDTEIQKFIESQDFSEKWLKDNWNWLYPVFTSISWNKSDRYMNRDFKLISVNKWNCEIVNTFYLDSKHNYSDKTKEEIRDVFDKLKITDNLEKDRLISIEWAWENRQFLRILTPKWSNIIDANWQNVIQDDSDPRYTFFKTYIKTDVGRINNFSFTYSSKPKNCLAKPIFYKQPWLSNYTFTSE